MIIKVLTCVHSVHCFTPIIGDSNVLVPLTLWKTGITATGAPGNSAQAKEWTPLKNAKRHAQKTIHAFSGTGEAETKVNVSSHGILDTGGRESRKKGTANGSISGLVG